MSTSMAIRITIVLVFVFAFSMQKTVAQFSNYYNPLWGLNHISVNSQGSEVQLLMDRSSGAGFRSKLDYSSGLFHIRMKIPENKTGGIVTSFYLTSAEDFKPLGTHYEIDFEFLGTNGTVQTNVYDNDGGHREQSFNLWFNPSQDFHTYEILWNTQQIIFLVDMIPIRVFKNNVAHGIDYPSKPMHVEASMWNADWSGVVDWSQAPFIASFQDFAFRACPTNVAGCHLPDYYPDLSAAQKQQMATYRTRFMTYDYCSKPDTWKPECALNI